MGCIISWATPSAAGPRTLLIAFGLQILGIVASDLGFSSTQACHFGVLGDPGTILRHRGAQQGTL